jgi:hypothetical protein
MWLGAVKKIFNSKLVATWLDGIPEIAAPVSVINGGTLTEKNIIFVPTTMFAADVLVNNTTYPIDVQQYADDTISFTLDKYQTKVTAISDDDTKGSSYDKIAEVVKGHTEPVNETKYQKALHSIAPAATSSKTPVMATTGTADATGRKRLVYEDLVAFKDLLDKNDTPKVGRRLVLCSDHFNDLLLDRKNFGDKFINYVAGSVISFLGFDMYEYLACPLFTTAGAKVAWGVANPPATAKQASIFFQKDNIGKKTGETFQYFTAAAQNPRTQSNELNYRHYFVAMPFLNNYIGAIVNG